MLLSHGQHPGKYNAVLFLLLLANGILYPCLYRYTIPAKAGQIIGTLLTAQLEIEQTQQGIGVGKRPGLVATLAFQAAEAGDFLPQQGVPVAIGFLAAGITW